MLGLCGFFMGVPLRNRTYNRPIFYAPFYPFLTNISPRRKGATAAILFGSFHLRLMQTGQWHKNHHNFYLQALQSTAVTILKSEEYCYEKHQPNADRCMAGTTETF